MESPEKMAIFKQKNHVIGLSFVADYVFCPPALENVCLYDWVSRSERVKKKRQPDIKAGHETASDAEQLKSATTSFLPSHPFASSHATRWLPPHKAGVPTVSGSQDCI